MTEAPDPQAADPRPESRPDLRPELAKWCEAWEGCFQKVLSQVSGQTTVFETSRQPLVTADTDVWYTVTAAGALRGEMGLHLPAASGTLLAQKLLSETPAPEAAVAITDEHKEALEELLRQVAGLAATALGAVAGGEVKLSVAASVAPSWSSDAVICLETRDEAGSPISIELQISPALAAELQPKPSIPAPPPPAAIASTGPDPLGAPPSSYRRLMDVGLTVKLRFGIRHMLLRDVLALSAGVVVELETNLHAPVDLILDDRRIAQGEVVIVDGKYGLRITDVHDPPPAANSAG